MEHKSLQAPPPSLVRSLRSPFFFPPPREPVRRLLFTKRGGVESGTTKHKSIQWQGEGFEPGTSSSALLTRQCCLHLLLAASSSLPSVEFFFQHSQNITYTRAKPATSCKVSIYHDNNYIILYLCLLKCKLYINFKP